MARFSIEGAELELPRNLALVDTNVLIAFVSENDFLHEQARLFIEAQNDFVLAIVPPVLVETCGFLAKRAHQSRVQFLLSWIQTPGSNILLLPAPHSPSNVQQTLAGHAAWMAVHGVDYVDAYLMEAANYISGACELRPHAPIVTFDTGDFLRCAVKGHSFSVYDMRDLQLVTFNS